MKRVTGWGATAPVRRLAMLLALASAGAVAACHTENTAVRVGGAVVLDAQYVSSDLPSERRQTTGAAIPRAAPATP